MSDDETIIRSVIENWAAAVRAVDMEGVLANHAEDMVMFDVPEPLQSLGLEQYRKTWELFYQYSPGGPNSFDLTQLRITTGDKAAFATAILTIFGSALRLTIGLRKEDGRWLIAHEHHSYAAKLDN